MFVLETNDIDNFFGSKAYCVAKFKITMRHFCKRISSPSQQDANQKRSPFKLREPHSSPGTIANYSVCSPCNGVNGLLIDFASTAPPTAKPRNGTSTDHLFIFESSFSQLPSQRGTFLVTREFFMKRVSNAAVSFMGEGSDPSSHYPTQTKETWCPRKL